MAASKVTVASSPAALSRPEVALDTLLIGSPASSAIAVEALSNDPAPTSSFPVASSTCKEDAMGWGDRILSLSSVPSVEGEFHISKSLPL